MEEFKEVITSSIVKVKEQVKLIEQNALTRQTADGIYAKATDLTNYQTKTDAMAHSTNANNAYLTKRVADTTYATKQDIKNISSSPVDLLVRTSLPPSEAWLKNGLINLLNAPDRTESVTYDKKNLPNMVSFNNMAALGQKFVIFVRYLGDYEIQGTTENRFMKLKLGNKQLSFKVTRKSGKLATTGIPALSGSNVFANLSLDPCALDIVISVVFTADDECDVTIAVSTDKNDGAILTSGKVTGITDIANKFRVILEMQSKKIGSSKTRNDLGSFRCVNSSHTVGTDPSFDPKLALILLNPPADLAI